MSQFEILEKSELAHIAEAINRVTSIPCLIDGEIKTEEDWNTKVQFKESVNADNVIVWTLDKPEGVTYAVVKAKQDELIAEYDSLEWKRKRQSEYPNIYDYMDGIVKNDQTQIDKYIADAQDVKARHPKGG